MENVEKCYDAKALVMYIFITYLITWASYGVMIVAIENGLFTFDSVISSILFGMGALGPAIAVWFLFRMGSFRHDAYLAFVLKVNKMKVTIILIIVFFIWRFIISNLFGVKIVGGSIMNVIYLIPRMLLYGGLEEIGWRGFLQPCFEKKLPFILATIATALIWSCWHIPLWFAKGSPQYGTSFLSFILSTTVISFTLAVIHQLTDAVLPCIICHTLHNALFTVWTLEANIGVMISFIIELIVMIYISCLNKNLLSGKNVKQ